MFTISPNDLKACCTWIKLKLSHLHPEAQFWAKCTFSMDTIIGKNTHQSSPELKIRQYPLSYLGYLHLP